MALLAAPIEMRLAGGFPCAVGFLPPAPHAVHHPRKGTGCLNAVPSPGLLWLAPSGHHQGCENHALPHPGPENGHSVASGPGLLAVYLTGKSAPCLGKPDRCRALKIHNSGLFQVSGEAQNRERDFNTSHNIPGLARPGAPPWSELAGCGEWEGDGQATTCQSMGSRSPLCAVSYSNLMLSPPESRPLLQLALPSRPVLAVRQLGRPGIPDRVHFLALAFPVSATSPLSLCLATQAL